MTWHMDPFRGIGVVWCKGIGVWIKGDGLPLEGTTRGSKKKFQGKWFWGDVAFEGLTPIILFL